MTQAGLAIHREHPCDTAGRAHLPLPEGRTMTDWQVQDHGFEDILFAYSKRENGVVAKLEINRPEVHNAFTPQTVQELRQALQIARDDGEVGAIILTGAGGKAFAPAATNACASTAATSAVKDGDVIPRLNVLDFQREIRSCPKPWWPWSPVGPSVAAMFYTSSAT